MLQVNYKRDRRNCKIHELDTSAAFGKMNILSRIRGSSTGLNCVAAEHKIINIGQPAYLAPLFRKFQSRTSSREGRELVVPPSRTDFGLKSFWSQGTRLWNSLPRDIRYLPSASRFKSAMIRYLLERSRDADCISM